jgi:hypothetical protein
MTVRRARLWSKTEPQHGHRSKRRRFISSRKLVLILVATACGLLSVQYPVWGGGITTAVAVLTFLYGLAKRNAPNIEIDDQTDK